MMVGHVLSHHLAAGEKDRPVQTLIVNTLQNIFLCNSEHLKKKSLRNVFWWLLGLRFMVVACHLCFCPEGVPRLFF